MAFQLSPGVTVREIDLTTVIPAVATSIGAFVGSFEWGPVGVPTQVSSEDILAQKFGTPSSNVVSTDFLTAAQFLAYSSNMQVVRVVEDTALNATVEGNAVESLRVDNLAQVEDGVVDISVGGAFVAKYPGQAGNSLKIVVLDETNFEEVGFEAESDLFDAAPVGDEVHVVVIDEGGYFSGIEGSTLETYAFVQTTEGAKKEDGSNNYFKSVIDAASPYVYVGDATDAAVGGDFTLTGGTVGLAVTDAEIQFGWDTMADAESLDINLAIVGARTATTAQYIVQNVCEVRKDCVAFISPEKDDVVGTLDATTNVVDFRSALNLNSSYGVLDSGWKYVFNKYLDRFEWIPLCGDTAGLCARTDADRDPWYSPAGFNRGNLKNVAKLAYNPNQAQRDTLYKAGVNPVVNFTGVGPILYGDKTLLVRPSAFDRINVRRLFIVLEKAIATAAKFNLFEFNDQFTRAQFVSLVEPFLREVQARRGITDFRVICDETNNTGQVIDTNRFIGDIYIKPARSINFITLNFIAVRTGVDFNEVVGQF